MGRYRTVGMLLLWLLGLSLPGAAEVVTDREESGAAIVTVASIQGAITPASSAYFLRALDEARQQQAVLLVLQLDTPGGLDTAMREMIQAILASEIPIAIYVAPSGARAASAGTYLLYASHIAAMSPGTNLGAATPIAIGAEPSKSPDGRDDNADDKSGNRSPPDDTMKAKLVHDASAYIRSLAQLRGRNAEWAEQAVRQAESLSASEALQRKVIDLMAGDLSDLLRQLDGRDVKLPSGVRHLALAGAELQVVERNWQERLLAAIADPNIALLLITLGAYALLFELYAPGMVMPGVLGGISLLLGLYGLALLPINVVGAALLLLGLGLMIVEGLAPSFGMLGLTGALAFLFGALMLVDAEVPELTVSWQLALPLALVSALAAVTLGAMAWRVRKRGVVSGVEAMIGAPGVALEDFAFEGWVRANGERWRAQSPVPLRDGQRVIVIAVNGLCLRVEPAPEPEGKTQGEAS